MNAEFHVKLKIAHYSMIRVSLNNGPIRKRRGRDKQRALNVDSLQKYYLSATLIVTMDCTIEKTMFLLFFFLSLTITTLRSFTSEK